MISDFCLDDVLEDNQIALLGCVITPWHAIGLKALSLYLEDAGMIESKYAIIQMHSANGQLIQTKDLQRFDVVQTLVPLAGLKERVVAAYCRIKFFKNQVVREGRGNLYIACPGYPGSYARTFEWVNCKRVATIYLLDEGVGSYLCDSKDWARWSTRDMSLSGIQALMRRVLGIFDEWYFLAIRRKLAEKGRFESFRLLDENGRPNDTAIKYYRRIMTLESVLGHEDEQYVDSVVVNTQPLVEDGFVDKDEYARVINAAVEQARSVGVNVVIKPHPRETDLSIYENLGCYLEKRQGVSQESILAALGDRGPYCLVGFNSTTLLSCGLLFGTRCVSLFRLINLEKCSDEYRDSACRFNEFVKGSVSFPVTVEDFRVCMQECLTALGRRTESPFPTSVCQ